MVSVYFFVKLLLLLCLYVIICAVVSLKVWMVLPHVLCFWLSASTTTPDVFVLYMMYLDV